MIAATEPMPSSGRHAHHREYRAGQAERAQRGDVGRHQCGGHADHQHSEHPNSRPHQQRIVDCIRRQFAADSSWSQ
jgi:hypothetical protein